MREFLLNNGAAIITVTACLEMLLTVILLIEAMRRRKPAVNILALLGFGLTLDAGILALGGHVSLDMLVTLSRVRYIAHGVIVPLNLAVCGYALRWEFTKRFAVTWVVTAVLAILGALAGIFRVLELREIAGVVRYAAADTSPAWTDAVNRVLSFGTVLPMLAAGVIAGKNEKNWYLFAGGFLMLFFSVLGPATGNADLIFMVSMFGELAMVVCYVLYERRAYRDGYYV